MKIIKKEERFNKINAVRGLIYGCEKSGKTTLAASVPNPLFILLDDALGINLVDSTELITTHSDFIDTLKSGVIKELKAGTFNYESIVIDDFTALERLIHKEILEKHGGDPSLTIASCLGGYGKGYDLATLMFADVIALLDVISLGYGINVFATAHSQNVTKVDSETGEYTYTSIQLHSPLDGKRGGKRELAIQWADLLIYLRQPLKIVGGKGNKGGVGLAKADGSIVAEVCPNVSFVAGNRYGLSESVNIPRFDSIDDNRSWDYVAMEIKNTSGLDFMS
jgi:hypothetical protein